jgi:hypothetical protein
VTLWKVEAANAVVAPANKIVNKKIPPKPNLKYFFMNTDI